MNFTRIPKPGAYMAIPLIYDSCRTTEALDLAVDDFINVERQKSEIERVIEKGQDPLDFAGADYHFLIKKRGDIDWLDYEQQKLQNLKLAPFRTVQKEYVLCLDTMGQEREFTDQEKRFALETVQRYIQLWEKCEQETLIADRDRRIKFLDAQREISD